MSNNRQSSIAEQKNTKTFWGKLSKQAICGDTSIVGGDGTKWKLDTESEELLTKIV